MRRLTTEEFIRKARGVHGDTYDYSRVNYRSANEKVEVVCPVHGSFWQRAADHFLGRGCPKCSKRERKTTEEFVRRAREVHGDRYDYSRVSYRSAHRKVEIVCPEHGSFWQTPNSHLKGRGCWKCSVRRRARVARRDDEHFIKRARKVHGDRYDYSRVVYRKSSEKVEIVCPEHGSFWQTPGNHVSREAGCPRCASRVSKAEQELVSVMKTWGFDVIHGYRKWCPGRPGLEIDIYIPSLSVGIEFNGDYWHSLKPEGYHEEKLRLAGEAGISLLMVWESEWKEDKEGVLRFLREFLEEKTRALMPEG